MYKFILVLLLSLANTAYSVGKETAVYNHLVRLNPKLDKSFAKYLANKVTFYSKQYRVDPRIVVAIMMQESSINPDNHRTAVGLDNYGNPVQVTTDVGLMQVNVFSVKAYDLNPFMLMTDHDYQLWAGIKILADKVRQCAPRYPETAWACFHSSTPRYHQEYVAAVRRWL
jgi:soluble lytic murein transglycosylase-like protein